MNRQSILISFIGLFFLSITSSAQKASLSDEGRISIKAFVADDELPNEASDYLGNKLQRILTDNGMADNQSATRFVLTAKINIISKDIVPSTPARISQKMELTFMVGDQVENKLFETYTTTLSGIGVNENKAFITAFGKINTRQTELRSMLENAKKEIITYYIAHCDEVIQKATTLQKMQKYDEAIYLLTSMPNVDASCFQRCQQEAEVVFTNKINHEGMVLLNEAKGKWTMRPDAVGASQTAALISRINPHSSVYPQVEKLRASIADKLNEDERKEWNLQMQKYRDNQQFKKSIVEACKAIGVAWGNGQPKSVTKTIVRSWW